MSVGRNLNLNYPLLQYVHGIFFFTGGNRRNHQFGATDVNTCILFLFLLLQYMNDATKWKELLEGLNVPDTIPELEESIHQHQTLIENITQAYTEVS